MWRIFQRPINLEPEKVDAVVMACCALHNYLIDRNVMAFTIDADAYLENGTWRHELQQGMEPLQRRQGGNNPGRQPKAMQDHLCHWFNSVGGVEWQERMVSIGQGLQQQLGGNE